MQNQYITQQVKTPLVSFIVTCYNTPVKMLQQCIDSILVLSLPETEREIILVDDGSDGCPINELMDYQDRIIYIRQKNSGVSAARNIGLQLCKGDYVQFVDGDDYLIQNEYEHCLDLVRYKNPDIVTFSFHDENPKSPSVSSDSCMSGSEYMKHNNLHSSVGKYIFRRNILGELHFSVGIVYGEDEEFTPQLFLRAENVIPTESRAYYYRNYHHSVTHHKSARNVMKRLNDTEIVLYHLYELSTTIPAPDQVALNRRIAQLTMDYIYNIIILTRSEHHLDRRLQRLRKRELFPLPDKDYTTKYKWFRKIINYKKGRQLLIKTLPLIKK